MDQLFPQYYADEIHTILYMFADERTIIKVACFTGATFDNFGMSVSYDLPESYRDSVRKMYSAIDKSVFDKYYFMALGVYRELAQHWNIKGFLI